MNSDGRSQGTRGLWSEASNSRLPDGSSVNWVISCEIAHQVTSEARQDCNGRRQTEEEDQLSPEVIYQLVADAGFRRYFHLGGLEATSDLIHRSNERAIREGVEDRVRFEVADAQNLPFEDNLFDYFGYGIYVGSKQ